MAEDGVYKTGDLVEASVLSMHGLNFSFERKGNRTLFIFVLTDREDPEWVADLVAEIRSAGCRVEPKRFARELKHVRELMYDFMGVRQGRRLQQH